MRLDPAAVGFRLSAHDTLPSPEEQQALIHANARLITMADGRTVFAGTSADDGGWVTLVTAAAHEFDAGNEFGNSGKVHPDRGIEKAQELHPDLIILDLSMPRLNGLEAARVLSKLETAFAPGDDRYGQIRLAFAHGLFAVADRENLLQPGFACRFLGE